MDTINIVINRFIRYMSKLGLEEWQLRIIFLIFIILLILIAIRKWKRRVKVHTIQDRNDQGIIGKRLYNHGAHHTEVKDSKENHQVLAPAKSIKEEKPDCRQSASEWEKAQEQISQLKHEITKHKQTEENLRQIIDELKKSKSQTLNETTESENIEHYIRHESFMPKNIDLQIPEVNQNEQTDKDLEKQSADHTAVNEESMEDITEDEQDGKGTKESGELMHTNNHDRGDTAEEKKDGGDSQQPGSPLDVMELKAIAELARRLGRNNHCQQ